MATKIQSIIAGTTNALDAAAYINEALRESDGGLSIDGAYKVGGTTAIDASGNYTGGSGSFSGIVTGSRFQTSPSNANFNLFTRSSSSGVALFVQNVNGSGPIAEFRNGSATAGAGDLKLRVDNEGIDVTGDVVASGTITGQNTEIFSNIIREYATDNDQGSININFNGFNGGTTRFRDFFVYNGKGAQMLKMDGSANTSVFSGTATATNFILSSDERLKTFKDDEEVVNVDSVKIRKFTFNDDSTQRDRYGVSAQELQKIAPEMVYVDTDKDQTLRVGYTDYLLAKVDSLEKRMKEMEGVI